MIPILPPLPLPALEPKHLESIPHSRIATSYESESKFLFPITPKNIRHNALKPYRLLSNNITIQNKWFKINKYPAKNTSWSERYNAFEAETNDYLNYFRLKIATWRLPASSSLRDTTIQQNVNSSFAWRTVEHRDKQEISQKSIGWIDPFNLKVRQKNIYYPKWEFSEKSISNHLHWEYAAQEEQIDVPSELDSDQVITGPVPALESMNRSIAFSTGSIGPDIGFLVPPGFRWTPLATFDASVRGWSRRRKGEAFLAWNGGDGVGQFFLQPIQRKRWSLGANLGVRSIYQGSQFAGGSSGIGEGVSAGFRFDYALSDTSGIAFGAEQLVHFDDKTDTGRDIYLVASKGWWLGGEKGSFPLATSTIGIGTGYLGRNPELQFGCSDAFGGAGISVSQRIPLCWGPIASGALVINPKISFFSEFNNFAFITGISAAPFKEVPLRATWGATLAQDFGGGSEDFRFEFDKTRWFFRISVGL